MAKSVIKFDILKTINVNNVTNIVKSVVKVENRNCNTFPGRNKRIEIKHVPFRDFGC